MDPDFRIKLITNILLALLSAYVVYEYYKNFFEPDSKQKKIGLCMIIYIGWQVFSMPEISNIPALLRLVLSIVFVNIVGWCFKGSAIGKFVFAIIYNAFWMLSELLLAAFFLNTNISIVKYNFLGSFLCEIFMLILVKLLQLFFRHSTIRNFSWRYNGVLMMLPLGCMFFSYHLFMLSAKSDEQMDFLITIAAFVAILTVIFLIFFMYIRLADAYELKRRNDILNLEIALYTEHMQEKETTMEQFRKSKHDLKHKLLYLLDMVKEKNYSNLEKYIEELVQYQSTDNLLIAHTDNFLIDAQVNYKYNEAARYGIAFKTEMNIPSSMPFDNADLCIILGNALDNAIEANTNQQVNNPNIYLKMKYKGESLVIVIENTFDGILKRDSKERILTRKSDKSSHGFGLESIQNILLKYHGYMNIDVTDTIFKLTIVMYRTKTEEVS